MTGRAAPTPDGERAGETLRVPDGSAVASPGWVARAVVRCHGWPQRVTAVSRVDRIGQEYGLTGHAYRVQVALGDGAQKTLVLKTCSADEATRARLFHDLIDDEMQGRIPRCFGSVSDPASGRGAIFLEDIGDAEQGDILKGCADDRALQLVRILARVHGRFWARCREDLPPGFRLWNPQPMDAARWTDRLAAARDRFPAILTDALVARWSSLPERLPEAVAALRAGPATLIHCDAHLDNALFRRDGTAVLLDWSGVSVGPPAVDLLRLLLEGTRPTPGPELESMLLSAYVTEARAAGADTASAAELSVGLRHAVIPSLQGTVGWAGAPDRPDQPARFPALRENLLRNLCSFVERTARA